MKIPLHRHLFAMLDDIHQCLVEFHSRFIVTTKYISAPGPCVFLNYKLTI
jgi:hypothetical protein